MCIKLTIILLLTGALFSSSVKCQNRDSEISFIGEINPSIRIGRGDNTSEILDFDQGLMVLYSAEVNQETRKKEVVISLIDITFKQFGKISVKQKINLPYSHQIEMLSGKRSTYNLLKFKYKVIDLGEHMIFIDYENTKISLFNTGTYVQSFYYDHTHFVPTKGVYANEKGDFVIEYVKRSVKNVNIFQIFNKQGEQINVVKKFNKFNPVCSYSSSLAYRTSYYYRDDLDCAHNNAAVHAFAETKFYKLKAGEKDSTVYVNFYENNYRDYSENKPIIKTYNFQFDKGIARNAKVSLDFKHIIINDKFIYALPKLEISK